MRGKRVPQKLPAARRRNIPAYAGKTYARVPEPHACAEHPRVCGENFGGVLETLGEKGTSSRMRGKPSSDSPAWSAIRNIPAYAGKTVYIGMVYDSTSEHPRVCGENLPAYPLAYRNRGTSPRMRGKHQLGCLMAADLRNIPAYAGKTKSSTIAMRVGSEHPRVCGENVLRAGAWALDAGTSPRMRGKPTLSAARSLCIRNIPAYAGKTPAQGWARSSTSEHPRVCGENLPERLILGVVDGTSPRMRGKHVCSANRSAHARNIPAYAGKTMRSRTWVSSSWEHPRVCGENQPATGRLPHWCGTSPRMRGKLTDSNGHQVVTQEHPRVCGANGNSARIWRRSAGTSPHTRGKRTNRHHRDFIERNIPAYAGKTLPWHRACD